MPSESTPTSLIFTSSIKIFKSVFGLALPTIVSVDVPDFDPSAGFLI
jgi:hypothetical protein